MHVVVDIVVEYNLVQVDHHIACIGDHELVHVLDHKLVHILVHKLVDDECIVMDCCLLHLLQLMLEVVINSMVVLMHLHFHLHITEM